MIKKHWKTTYEKNFNCFDIRDFRKLDSVTVYIPKKDTRVRGVITSVDQPSYQITIKTKQNKSFVCSLDNVLYLKDYDKDWLA